MMVQQLAGCYWKLAKVWTFETEAAWRSLGGEQSRLRGIGRIWKKPDSTAI